MPPNCVRLRRLKAGAYRHSSELIPQRELHLSRRRSLLKFTKRQRSCEREAWIGEVHGIERIECFCTEANSMPFLRKPERLLQREIGIETVSYTHLTLPTIYSV